MMKPRNTAMGQAIEFAMKIYHSPEMEDEMEDEESDEGYHLYNDQELAPAEKQYVESMYDIVEEYGKLADNDGNGIWVGYMSAAQNDNKSIGVKCSNCAFYCKEMRNCHIISANIEPSGLCRLAAIGEGVVKGKRK